MSPKKTALYQSHVDRGAQMVEFANTLLPVRFQSEKEEHLAVRKSLGIFDVSHMGEFTVCGIHARAFLQHLLTNNIDRLAVGGAQYSLLLNEQAGIVDDLIIYRLEEDQYFLCVNAANIEKDWRHVSKHAEQCEPCDIKNVSDDYSQFALQGRKSEALLAELCIDTLPERFTIKRLSISGIATLVARTGYSGEDGFEIFVKNSCALDLYEMLLSHGKKHGLRLCGLAARDSLRLEAGLLLHGQDMDENTTPLEAGLLFAVDLNKPDFVGKDKLVTQKKIGAQKKLVGFRLIDKGLARHGFRVLNENLQEIGVVTSATYLPESQEAVGFAYVTSGDAYKGNRILIDIRGRPAAAQICSMRFLNR